MNVNTKVLINSLGILSVVLIIWVVYLLNHNKELQSEYDEVEMKYEATDGFSRLLQLELDVSRDSVRLLEQRMDRLKSELEKEGRD